MDQIALYGAAGGVLLVDLVLPLGLRVEGVGEDVTLGIDHEHLRVAIDEGSLPIADERQRGPPVTLDALGRHVDQLDHEAAIRHEVVHAAAHDVALTRRALHAAQERRLPGRFAAARTLALVEHPRPVPLAGEGLDAPAAEGAALGAVDGGKVRAHARPPRAACQGRRQIRGGLGPCQWGRTLTRMTRDRGAIRGWAAVSSGLVLLAGAMAWWWHRPATFALPDRLPVDRVVAELAAALPDSSGVRRAPLAPRRGLLARAGPRDALIVAPGSRLPLRLRVPAEAVLAFSVGVEGDGSKDRQAAGVRFRVLVDGVERFVRVVNPAARRADRVWFDEQVDLSAEAGREVEIVFATDAADA